MYVHTRADSRIEIYNRGKRDSEIPIRAEGAFIAESITARKAARRGEATTAIATHVAGKWVA